MPTNWLSDANRGDLGKRRLALVEQTARFLGAGGTVEDDGESLVFRAPATAMLETIRLDKRRLVMRLGDADPPVTERDALTIWAAVERYADACADVAHAADGSTFLHSGGFDRDDEDVVATRNELRRLLGLPEGEA